MRFLQHCQGFVLIFLLLFANFRVGIKQRQLYKELLGQHLTFIHKFTLSVFFFWQKFFEGSNFDSPPAGKKRCEHRLHPPSPGPLLKAAEMMAQVAFPAFPAGTFFFGGFLETTIDDIIWHP